MPDESVPFTVPLAAYLGAVISHDVDRESSLLDRVQIHVEDGHMTNVVTVECLGQTFDVTVTMATPE
jgi:hypothetical protein